LQKLLTVIYSYVNLLNSLLVNVPRLTEGDIRRRKALDRSLNSWSRKGKKLLCKTFGRTAFGLISTEGQTSETTSPFKNRETD